MKLKIHKWPDKILKKKCQKISKIDEVIQNIIDQMYLLMKVSDGVGLAANQAGLDLCLIVVEAEGKIFKLINPEIIDKEGVISFREGCLSFPGIELAVKRSRKIKIKALNENGDPVSFEAEGALAIVFQHEIDHINGISFIDRVSFWQRLKTFPKLKKIKRRGE